MAIKIDISRIGGDANLEISAPDNALDETMFLAQENDKGVELEYTTEKEAVAARFRFYRRIKQHRERGRTSFDNLVFTVAFNVLTITQLKLPIVRVKE